MYFNDNGQIRSFDNNHRIVFLRSGDRDTMEFREYGKFVWYTGTGQEKMRLSQDGTLTVNGYTEIYNDEDLLTQKDVNAFASSMVQRHTHTNIHVEFTVSLTNAPQNYAALQVGQSVVVNISELSTTTLMIHESVYIKNSKRELLKLILVRRTI